MLIMNLHWKMYSSVMEMQAQLQLQQIQTSTIQSPGIIMEQRPLLQAIHSQLSQYQVQIYF